MRGFGAAVATLITLIIFDFYLRSLFSISNPFTFFSALLGTLTSFFFWMWVAQIREIVPSFLKNLWAASIACFLTALTVISYFTVWKLGDYINAYMLVFVSVDRGFVPDQLRLYGFSWASLGLVPIWLYFYWIWKPGHRIEKSKKKRSWIPWKPVAWSLVWAALCLVALNQVKYETVGQHKWPDASLLLAVKNYRKSTRLNVLRSSVRIKVPDLKVRERPDLLIFIGESFTKKFLKIYGFERESMPHFTEVFTGSDAFVMNRALTNSSATDVSLPSLFAGVGPEESDEKLHELPLIWDWLKSAGYYTIFASPQKFAFANFDAFMLSPGPNAYLSADRFMSLEKFLVAHNNGLDDVWAAKETAKRIREAEPKRPLALIYFTNATHYPFLQTSPELTEQPSFPTLYENSQWLTDQSLMHILKAFEESRNMDRLLIWTSADHGELERSQQPVARIASFYDEILAIPFAVRLPKEKGLVREECRMGLEKNRNRLVQNLDLLPTLLDLLGYRESADHQVLIEKLKGRSLCEDVGNERVIVALNTNNIRHWDPEGFLLARDQDRLVFSNAQGMRYFDVNQDPDQTQNRLKSIPESLAQEFDLEIKQNLQLSRIQNLYFPEGLLKEVEKVKLQKNSKEK